MLIVSNKIASTHCKEWFDSARLRHILKAIKKLEGALIEVITFDGEKHTVRYDKDYKTWNFCYFMKLGECLTDSKKNPNKYLQRIDMIESICIKHA